MLVVCTTHIFDCIFHFGCVGISEIWSPFFSLFPTEYIVLILRTFSHRSPTLIHKQKQFLLLFFSVKKWPRWSSSLNIWKLGCDQNRSLRRNQQHHVSVRLISTCYILHIRLNSLNKSQHLSDSNWCTDMFSLLAAWKMQWIYDLVLV